MTNNKVMHEVDVFGLFNALYSKGSAKLSDHFLDDEPGTAGDGSREFEK